MKKQQNTKRMLFEMMEKMNPNVQFNKHANYTVIEDNKDVVVNDGSLEPLAEWLANELFDDILSIARSKGNDEIKFDFNVPPEKQKISVFIDQVTDAEMDININEVNGVLSTFVDWGEEQKGYGTGGSYDTEPISGYYGIDAKLEHINLIDDANKTIYKLATDESVKHMFDYPIEQVIEKIENNLDQYFYDGP